MFTADTARAYPVHSTSSDALDLDQLDWLQRLLVTSDGTLTELIEAVTGERILLVRIDQHAVIAEAGTDPLDARAADHVLERSILLQGAGSRINYVHAESRIVASRLPPVLARALTDSDLPIGRLWKLHRLEMFKERAKLQWRSVGRSSRYFGADADASLVSRSYRVFTGGRPVALIRERFSPTLLCAAQASRGVLACCGARCAR
jgi:chorismate-pyruvate lyase